MSLPSFPGIPDPTSQGYYEWQGYKTWYRITGDLSTSTLAPVIVLHGGPGATHSYTLQMANLASEKRTVIHYDQIGCGNSTHLREKAGDAAFWVPELFLTELNGLIAHLKIESYYVIGQSWGGYLGFSHALEQPKGFKGFVNADGIASWAKFSEGCMDWIEQLPEEHKRNIQHGLKTGDYKSDKFKISSEYFYSLHVCRKQPMPAEVAYTFSEAEKDPTVYNCMNGPNEFTVVGSMKDETLEDRLGEIKIPVLHVNGKYDEVNHWVTKRIQERIKGSEWYIYDESSHMPHTEEAKKWLGDVNAWLDKQDAVQSKKALNDKRPSGT